MLNRNKTYDNSNLRDVQKVFNDGVAVFYEACERVAESKKGKKFFSRESISFETYTRADQNSKTIVKAIGVPEGGFDIEHGDVVIVNGEQYIVSHAQLKTYEHPNWYKVYLERPTIEYEIVQ